MFKDNLFIIVTIRNDRLTSQSYLCNTKCVLVRMNRLLLPFHCKTLLLNSNRKTVSLYCYNNARRVGKLDVELAEDASALRPEPTFDTSQTFSCTSYMFVNHLFCKITFDIESHITVGLGIKSYECSSHKARYPGCYMK